MSDTSKNEEIKTDIGSDDDSIKGAIEAMLYAFGEPLTAEAMALGLGVKTDKVLAALTSLQDDYTAANRGIYIVRLNDGYELATKKDYYDILCKVLARETKYVFSDAMLETLSIVAYKQPVTRTQIEYIRGVSCSNSINRLVEFGLIAESGRLDAPGRPFLFSTTDDFLRRFNLSSLDDLPDVSEDLLGQMKLEVENEVPGEETESEDEEEKEGAIEEAIEVST